MSQLYQCDKYGVKCGTVKCVTEQVDVTKPEHRESGYVILIRAHGVGRYPEDMSF